MPLSRFGGRIGPTERWTSVPSSMSWPMGHWLDDAVGPTLAVCALLAYLIIWG